MKRIGVAAVIQGPDTNILLARRNKDPNRGLFVLPGDGIEDGETLEQALVREILEETGVEIHPTPKEYSRWERPYLIELPDRIILVARAYAVPFKDTPRDGSDLYDVDWFDMLQLPQDISPVVYSMLSSLGYKKVKS